MKSSRIQVKFERPTKYTTQRISYRFKTVNKKLLMIKAFNLPLKMCVTLTLSD